MKNQYLKVKGSSIIETVIAITIISICSLIATLVFVKVIDTSSSLNKYTYEYELEKLIEETKNNEVLDNATFIFQNYTIERHVEKNIPYTDANTIVFFVRAGKKVFQYNLLVYSNEKI